MPIEEKYLQPYFGKRSRYYVSKYKAFCDGQKFTFNVSAFFAGTLWFLYRKLYVEAFVITLVIAGLESMGNVLLEIFSMDTSVKTFSDLFLTLAFATFCGFGGNYLYLKRTVKSIKNILSLTTAEERRINFLKLKGGVAWAPVALILLSAFLLLLILTDGFKEIWA